MIFLIFFLLTPDGPQSMEVGTFEAPQACVDAMTEAYDDLRHQGAGMMTAICIDSRLGRAI